MKNLPLTLLAAVALATGSSFAGLDAYNGDYSGPLTVKGHKKAGTMSGDCSAVASMTGDAADFSVVASGAKGVRANVEISLASDGSASLAVDCKVLADPKLLSKGNGKGNKGQKGKKVRVKYSAMGTYTLGDDGVTVSLAVSNNKGKAGNNVTGTISQDETGGIVIVLNSGFKQSQKGIGKKMSISYQGTKIVTE